MTAEPQTFHVGDGVRHVATGDTGTVTRTLNTITEMIEVQPDDRDGFEPWHESNVMAIEPTCALVSGVGFVMTGAAR